MDLQTWAVQNNIIWIIINDLYYNVWVYMNDVYVMSTIL